MLDTQIPQKFNLIHYNPRPESNNHKTMGLTQKGTPSRVGDGAEIAFAQF